MQINRRSRPKPHIDMTPLIDCIFTLLIVIMLVASFQSMSHIDMKLPEAQTQDDKDAPELVINVDSHGKYFLNSEPIDVARLEQVLKPRIEKSKRKVVTFCGDRKIPYEAFVRVVDAARASGAKDIDIVHELPARK